VAEDKTMDPVTTCLGVAAIGFGAYTTWARRTRPEQFGKLEPMKRMWGERGGVIVHAIGYSVIPIFVGLLFLLSGLAGVSLF
jgi:hypothetical protein